MKVEESMSNEGFEEVTASGTQEQTAQKSANPNRPDLRVVQVETDREGRAVYKNVGGMWKNVSKNGNEFYTLLIGNLKLLVFPNTNK
jgi:hypothetical protein